jgi:hypothetical protein
MPSKAVDGIAAKALLEVGKPALRYLAPILDDNTDALLFGSKHHMMSMICHYRRNDCAYRYASLILGRSPQFYNAPERRDKEIKKLKEVLKKATD